MNNPKYGIGYEDHTGKILFARTSYNTLQEAESQAETLELHSGGMRWDIYELVKIPRRREKKDEAQAWGDVTRRGVFGTL